MKLQATQITDGYKVSHPDQLDPGTEFTYSNLTARAFHHANVLDTDKSTVRMRYFGGQYAIKEYIVNVWNTTFFNKPKEEVIGKVSRRLQNYLGKGRAKTTIEKMGQLHDLGYLPISIKTLPEGSAVGPGLPVLTITNTHKDFGFLTNYLETLLSAVIWPMCNAASLSEQYYLLSKKYAELTGASMQYWLPIANHNFSARGMRGVEDMTTSSAAHLLFSVGTDTLTALDFIEDYYNGNSDEELIGCSVNAAEHATATQLIQIHGGESKALRHLLTNIYPTGIFSYVSDSHDYWNVVGNISAELKEVIISRQPDENGQPGILTFRPDSSKKTPLEIMLGDPEAEAGSFEQKGTLQTLWDNFGGELVFGPDGKQYKLLDSHVRIIYGEAISLTMAYNIYEKMAKQGWCVGNVFFGVGSWAFLANSSRDSYGLAIKSTYTQVSGKAVELFKNPKTSSFKKSAKGLLRVDKDAKGEFVLKDQQTWEQEAGGELRTVFKDGILLIDEDFATIRRRVGFINM